MLGYLNLLFSGLGRQGRLCIEVSDEVWRRFRALCVCVADLFRPADADADADADAAVDVDGYVVAEAEAEAEAEGNLTRVFGLLFLLGLGGVFWDWVGTGMGMFRARWGFVGGESWAAGRPGGLDGGGLDGDGR